MFGPVVSHPACDLEQQARLQRARRSALVRRLGRSRRPTGPQTPEAGVADAALRGSEDVWRSLRF